MAEAWAIRTGRTIALSFSHGEDFLSGLETVCRDNRIRGAYIPMFIAGFAHADLVGTCESVDDPQAPVWSSVRLERLEAVGAGTIAFTDSDEFAPHIHVAAGLKLDSASGRTSHLLAAVVQFLVEMIVVEVLAPTLIREREPTLYDVPLLRFRPTVDPNDPQTCARPASGCD